MISSIKFCSTLTFCILFTALFPKNTPQLDCSAVFTCMIRKSVMGLTLLTFKHVGGLV